MKKSYWITKNRNLTPNIRKKANSGRIVKSLTAASSKRQNFLQGMFQSIVIKMSILYGL